MLQQYNMSYLFISWHGAITCAVIMTSKLKTCTVEIIEVLALLLLGRGLFEREGGNTLPTNNTAEGTLCSH